MTSRDSATLSNALAGRYRIERELGAGGMATVYLAEDLKHHRQVAIKVLREDLAASMGASRFLREIEIAAQLQHPHILTLLDSGDAGGFLYYVMPYVKGQSLRERLTREGELPIHEAVRLTTEVVDALSHAHEHGVVHRDIKPDNVMLSGRHALVADFGVAKAVSEASGRTTVTTLGVAVGTPAYMSPEQAAADPHVDHRSDIYAVGTMAYEMLTGRPPFSGATPQQVLAAQVSEIPDPVSKRRPGVPPALEQVVMRCLAKRPADRFQTAADLLAQLEPMMTSSAEGTPTDTRPLAPRSPRRWLWMSATGAAAAAVVVLSAMSLVRRGAADAAMMVGATHTVTSEAGLYLDPAISPDGKLLAYAQGTPAHMHLFVRSVDGERSIPLTDSMPGLQRWPQWSPDGSQIVFWAVDGIWVVPALGGPARQIVVRRDADLHSATWSSDGRRVAYVRRGEIRAFDLRANRDTLITDLRKQKQNLLDPYELEWSPDGRWIAAANGNDRFAFGTYDLANIAPSTLYVINVGDGHVVHLAAADANDRTQSLSPVWMPDSRHLLFVSTREGGRDVYELALSARMEALGPPVRLTTGLAAHSISLTANGKRLAYSSYRPITNIWSVPVPAGSDVSAATGHAITHGTDLIEEVAASLDGKSVAFVATRSGTAQIFRMPSDGGEAVQITSGANEQFGPRWSPNGAELVCWSVRNGMAGIYVVSVNGGAVEAASPTALWGMFPDWSPDGNHVVFVGIDSSRGTSILRIISRSGSEWGAPKSVLGADWGTAPSWSPDANAIAFFGAGGLETISANGGTPRIAVPYAQIAGSPFEVAWSRDSRVLYYLAADSVGTSAIWAVAAAEGSPRRVVRFDDPDLQPGRAFGIDAKNVYVRLIQHRAEMGTAELRRGK